MPPDPATSLWDKAWVLGGSFVLVALTIAVLGVLNALWRARPRPESSTAQLPSQKAISGLGTGFLIFWGLFSAVGLATIGISHQQIWLAMDRSRVAPTVVEAMGLQYAWSFRTPGPDGQFGPIRPNLQSAENPFGLSPSDSASADDEVSYGEVQTTAGVPITFLVRSLDVLHSFYLPDFRNQVNAMPGRVAHFTVEPTSPAQYSIVCNQFCGLGHYRMNALWKVVPAAPTPAATD
jgi:heme/copper-type cytochrome/quinol oxidase subunit 2